MGPETETGAAAPKVSETETAVGDHAVSGGGLPQEVVIKGEGGTKVKARKPPLEIASDPFESIRDSLKTDQNLLLAESPLTVVWRRTHPDFLLNPRVIEPWQTTFSDRPGLIFRVRDVLGEVLGRKVENREAKGYQWKLTVADEDGKTFQEFEGSSSPPEEIIWDGQNDRDEWLRPGKAYSPIYMFTDSESTPYTRAGKPIKFKGVIHQERTGLHISLDSTFLFGSAKEAARIQEEGANVLRSAADLVKRRYSRIPIRVEAYARTKPLADAQAQGVRDYFTRELMLMPQDISMEGDSSGFADQRVEVILLNR
jgi:hypothetical protein